MGRFFTLIFRGGLFALLLLGLSLPAQAIDFNDWVVSLTNDSSPVGTSLLYEVTDPGGTPTSKKVTIATLLGLAGDIQSVGDCTSGACPGTTMTWGEGGASVTWTFNVTGTDPVFTFSDGTINSNSVFQSSNNIGVARASNIPLFYLNHTGETSAQSQIQFMDDGTAKVSLIYDTSEDGNATFGLFSNAESAWRWAVTTLGAFTVPGSIVIGDGTQATRTLWADVLGTDPVITFGDGTVNISTGTLKVGGLATLIYSDTANCVYGNNGSKTQGCYTSISMDDSAAQFYNVTTDTKKVKIDASGLSASETATIKPVGAYTLTYTLTGATGVTFPTSGTLATLAGSESLTNKKLGSLTTNGFVKTSGGDGTLSVDTASYITASSTDTLTNKTLDVESTGNSITMPVKTWIAAAGCNNTTATSFWDLPTSNPAVAACRTGTNTQRGVLGFADGANALTAQINIKLPSDWTGAIDADVYWTAPVATSGDVVWQIAIACASDGESDDPAFTDQAFTADAAKGTVNQLNIASKTNITTTGTCAAGDMAFIRIKRDPAHASDTMSGTANLTGVELTFRRAM